MTGILCATTKGPVCLSCSVISHVPAPVGSMHQTKYVSIAEIAMMNFPTTFLSLTH